MNFIKLFVVALLLTATTQIAFAQTSCCKGSDNNSQCTTTGSTDSIKTASVKVKGVTCSMDVKMISSNVEKLNGVNSCKSGKQGTTTTFDVKFNPALVTEKEIFAVIESTGSCENPKEKPYKVKL